MSWGGAGIRTAETVDILEEVWRAGWKRLGACRILKLHPYIYYMFVRVRNEKLLSPTPGYFILHQCPLT